MRGAERGARRREPRGHHDNRWADGGCASHHVAVHPAGSLCGAGGMTSDLRTVNGPGRRSAARGRGLSGPMTDIGKKRRSAARGRGGRQHVSGPPYPVREVKRGPGEH
ncbi:hypothetical protein HMPREF0682_2386 [Propionibacterium acidifaciens F0233]|uniref:Uncharacterized protein n=1 Tax=Propionibacterium acidifaciens F0233 TaxID=553198 RepID=U2QX69_9ACTN|nr:hypothetical protein HMPREF0682_2386 [Propionibacterium acidifaciens F0233]